MLPVYKVCDWVEFIDEEAHRLDPTCYPTPGTIGQVYGVDPEGSLLIKWPKGSIELFALWWTDFEMVRKVEKK